MGGSEDVKEGREERNLWVLVGQSLSAQVSSEWQERSLEVSGGTL